MAYFDKYGVEFSDNRKNLERCPRDLEGEYIIPDSVTRIRMSAFGDCGRLTSVTIPDSVTVIEQYAFANCRNLTSIKIPDSVTMIEYNAFERIANIIYNGNASGYPWGARCVNGYISEMYIYESAAKTKLLACSPEFIGESVIANSVKYIGSNAFYGCSGLTSVTIPSTVTVIEYDAFWECPTLDSINVDSTNANYCSMDGVLFSKDRRALLKYPEGKQGTNYVIPYGVQYIKKYAFCKSKLHSVNIPATVTRIEYGAFSMCYSLCHVNIPDNTYIVRNGEADEAPFFCVPNIECKGREYDNLMFGAKCINGYVENSFVYKDSTKKDLLSCALFDNDDITIPNGVITIGEWAFGLFSNLRHIVIPDTVTHIGNTAFGECQNLESINIPDGVTHIGDCAFYYCRSLKAVTIPNSVISIGWRVFSECRNLREIIVPADHEERFCQMEGLKEYADIIRKISRIRREEQEQRLIELQQMQEMLQGSTLFFDTETIGTPSNYKAPVTDSYNWPRLVQLAWIMADKNGNVLKKKSLIIKPDGFSIPSDVASIHGITTERAQREGKPLQEVLEEFAIDLSFAERVVGHNIDFDQHIVGAELYRLNMDYDALMNKPCICTMKSSTDFCAIPNPNPYYGGYKWPSLQELYRKLFGRSFDDAHDALADITATKECFFELKRRGIL